jgi:outer membrane immunogenic protein
MKKLLAAVAIIGISTASAFAADLGAQPYTKAPMMEPAVNWSGFYVGGQLGGASVSSRFKDYNDEFDNQGLNPDRKTSFTGGGYGGYNLQFGSFVVGVDAQWSVYDATLESFPFGVPNGSYLRTRLNDAGSVKGRVGLAFTDTLVYVAAGPAWANATFSAFESGVFGFPAVSEKHTVSGFAAAAGVEHMVTPNWIVRGQVQYSEFDTHRLVTALGRLVPPTFGQETSVLEATVGVSYKFGPIFGRY